MSRDVSSMGWHYTEDRQPITKREYLVAIDNGDIDPYYTVLTYYPGAAWNEPDPELVGTDEGSDIEGVYAWATVLRPDRMCEENDEDGENSLDIEQWNSEEGQAYRDSVVADIRGQLR